jgi:hypothetical protein
MNSSSPPELPVLKMKSAAAPEDSIGNDPRNRRAKQRPTPEESPGRSGGERRKVLQ